MTNPVPARGGTTPAVAFKRAAGAIFPYLPNPIRSRIFPPHLTWNRRDVHCLPLVENAPIRVLFAPANYAAQGHLWAKAASTLPGVAAVNLQYKTASSLRFPANASISKAMSAQSLRWSHRASDYILGTFTHIVIEAEQPFLGARYQRNIYSEVQAMLDAGIQVAFASHGSDLRTPSLHRQLNPFSPFSGPLGGLTDDFERSTDANHRLLTHFDLPVFVPTPDILAYIPHATWLPLTVDSDTWSTLPTREWPMAPRFLHIPSRPELKGTESIRHVLKKAEADGLVEYRELQGLTPNQVRSEIAAADVIIDQLTMGLYSTTAVEAMTAGKLVIAEVSTANRDRIKAITGWDCPVIEATPDTLETVVSAISQDPSGYHRLQIESARYAAQVHGQHAVADVLRGFLGLPPAVKKAERRA